MSGIFISEQLAKDVIEALKELLLLRGLAYYQFIGNIKSHKEVIAKSRGYSLLLAEIKRRCEK
jgi:hypothetical protein